MCRYSGADMYERNYYSYLASGFHCHAHHVFQHATDGTPHDAKSSDAAHADDAAYVQDAIQHAGQTTVSWCWSGKNIITQISLV